MKNKELKYLEKNQKWLYYSKIISAILSGVMFLGIVMWLLYELSI